ncbi:hypothetical protein [Campylobacter sp. 19-13652]|uniref:hypothetical protein n=1 Tax=Campylobacter sp. 19-13652 TaxID=2840180 RepID=UPI001C78F70C|nr:hypothetical protein [Campylobacter sp. 19-13652]BCX80153.1 hypothetical protein LBC_16150 [Campylobacter sp. 19-13652]
MPSASQAKLAGAGGLREPFKFKAGKSKSVRQGRSVKNRHAPKAKTNLKRSKNERLYLRRYGKQASGANQCSCKPK